MGAELEFCCEAVRRRRAGRQAEASHKLSQSQQVQLAEDKERKIQDTDVTFYQFWCECIDWDMIKLFYALLMLFFCVVGIACFFYLFYVFNYNENLWYFYFPVGKKYREGF